MIVIAYGGFVYYPIYIYTQTWYTIWYIYIYIYIIYIYIYHIYIHISYVYIYIYISYIYMHMMYIYIYYYTSQDIEHYLDPWWEFPERFVQKWSTPKSNGYRPEIVSVNPHVFLQLNDVYGRGQKKWRLGFKNEILNIFFILLLMFAHFWTSPPRIASQRVQEGYFCNLIWFHLTGSIWTSYPNGYPKYIERTTSLAMSGFPCSFPKSGVIKSWVSKISTPVSNQKSCFGLVPNGLPRRDFQTQIWTPRISTGKIYLRNRTLVLCSLTVKKNHVLDKRMNHSVIGVGHKSH